MLRKTHRPLDVTDDGKYNICNDWFHSGAFCKHYFSILSNFIYVYISLNVSLFLSLSPSLASPKSFTCNSQTVWSSIPHHQEDFDTHMFLNGTSASSFYPENLANLILMHCFENSSYGLFTSFTHDFAKKVPVQLASPNSFPSKIFSVQGNISVTKSPLLTVFPTLIALTSSVCR